MLSDLFIVPRLAPPRIEVSFTAPAGCTGVPWRAMDGQRPVASGCAKVADGGRVSFEASWPQPRLWSIDDPHLYELQLELQERGGSEQINQPFGLRTIEVRGTDILVNGQPFYVRGFIRGREAHEHANLLDLPLEEFYAKSILGAKRYGFNLVRFHSRIPPEECFRAADRLGIFVHVEIRKYFGKYQKERAEMKDEGEIIDEAAWRQTVLELRNHPSLMVYCMGNEIRHPGSNPFVGHIARLTKQLDPTRLFLDTCAHGEFDRDNVDFDVQHMSYFYPFGKDYDMFENTYNWRIYGSAKGVAMDSAEDAPAPAWRVVRAIQPTRPVLAHEICHYVALLGDLDALDAKFRQHCPQQRPWWIDELKALVRLKGHEAQYGQMMEASRRWQFIGWKLGIEAARRSGLLAGFHFLHLADTDRYESANGLLDCFDDSKGVDEQAFLRFNGDTVLLADLPRRTYFEGQSVRVPVQLAHFSPRMGGLADFAFRLESISGPAIRLAGALKAISLDERGRREICQIELALPAVAEPAALRLTCDLKGQDGSYAMKNSWNLWVYPNRPAELPPTECTIDLAGVHLGVRYPQLRSTGTPEQPEKLLIAHRFSAAVFDQLRRGGDVLMLYRVDETRDRRTPATPETYYLPATWDRCKGVVWDRGTNCGAIVRPHPCLAGFPNDGFLDLQFRGLIDDCDKICLDGFPVAVEPIIEGVDKASRDRFDCFNDKLRELQPGWTMRRFAYGFELRVGAGRLFVTGLNFTGIARDEPEVCAMFESIWRHVTSDAFALRAAIAPDVLERYLLERGRAPRIKERRMTQYWQLNDAPLESDRYWKEADAYVRQGPQPEVNRQPLTARPWA